MSDSPDYILDLSNQQQADAAQPMPEPPAEAPPPEDAAAPEPASSRKWIGVHFKCCDVYTRIWRNREGTAYTGICPRCHRRIQARIGPDGVSARMFEAC